MNRQLLAELEVSSSDSSPDTTPIQDPTDLQDHTRRLADIRPNIENANKKRGVISPQEHYFLKIIHLETDTN